MIYVFSIIEENFGFLLSSLSQGVLKLTFALLIFLLGFILGKLIGRLVYKMLSETEVNSFIKNTTGLKLNFDHLISVILTYFIYLISLLLMLIQIGAANIVLYILSALVLFFLIVSLFLALKDLVPNFVSGIYLYSREGLRVGSQVDIDNITGELVHIDLFHVKVKTKKGDIIYIPNSYAITSKVRIKG